MVIAANALAKQWREFKKSYPEFEKSKGFKGDVGPQLDKIDKLQDKRYSLNQEVKATLGEIVKLSKSVVAALKGYESVAKDIKSSNPGIDRDIKDILDEAQSLVDAYGDQYNDVK